jgi:hypothetical protein
MTIKDLQKVLTKEQMDNPEFHKLLARLKDKPFWIWDKQQHRQEDIKTKGDCCFNHIIGLPTKGNIQRPMYDYEKLLYDKLFVLTNEHNGDFKDKHLWVKKATGLGITEFFLRIIAWLCTKNNEYRNTSICIVTAPRIELAVGLITRLKGLFLLSQEQQIALSIALEQPNILLSCLPLLVVLYYYC